MRWKYGWTIGSSNRCSCWCSGRFCIRWIIWLVKGGIVYVSTSGIVAIVYRRIVSWGLKVKVIMELNRI